MFKNIFLSKTLYNRNNILTNITNKYFTNCSDIPNFEYTAIKVSTPELNVRLIQLFRPEKKNALNSILIKDLNHALNSFEKNNSVSAIVLCGDKEFFAAGADIKEMSDKTFAEVYENSMLEEWNYISKIR